MSEQKNSKLIRKKACTHNHVLPLLTLIIIFASNSIIWYAFQFFNTNNFLILAMEIDT